MEQGPNMATPLVHNGVMFLASAQDSVLALDATTGEQLWEYKHRPTGFPSPRIGIALHGDKVIVPTQNMQVVALKVATGELIWKHEIETPQHEEPLGVTVFASRCSNGSERRGAAGVTATMIPEGGFLVGLDLKTGDELWRFHSIARHGEAGGNGTIWP